MKHTNIDINKEHCIKNLFTILSADRDSRIFAKKGITETVRELGVSRDTLSQWFESWKKNTGAIHRHTAESENRNMVYLLCAAILSDETVHDEVMKSLLNASMAFGVDAGVISSVFTDRKLYTEERSVLRRADMIRAACADPKAAAVKPGSAKKNTSFYVANQVTGEGFDELQRLMMAHRLGCHAAIDGPPGVGKTHSVIEISDILGMSLYTKTCSSRTTESHIISYPVLSVKDGASVTMHVNGPLVSSMIEPGIFYGDEFNLLKEDVQKRLNSCFDERRYIDRNDGVQVTAKPGFWAVISYNPTQSITSRDLEDSVADRFVHLHYHRWDPGFKAYIAHNKARAEAPDTAGSLRDFGIVLSWRGISPDCRFFSGTGNEGAIQWADFFTGEPVKEKPAYVYSTFRNPRPGYAEQENMRADLDASSYSEIEFARMLSQFTDLLQSLKRTGKSPLLKKLNLDGSVNDEDLELLNLHESSARIEVAALKHYHFLLGKGCRRYPAQSYAVKMVIDQICYGQYRDRKLRDRTAYELVRSIAVSMRLLADFTRYNTAPAAVHSAKN